MAKKANIIIIISIVVALGTGIILGWAFGAKKATQTASTTPSSDNSQSSDTTSTSQTDDQTITEEDLKNSGVPIYSDTVMESYRKLQYKTKTYEKLPQRGSGLRLGIYQVQANWGTGASKKNMDRLEQAVKLAKEQGVQLLSFPELYVPGYTLSPDQAKEVAEYKDGTSITRAKQIAHSYNIALILPYAEKVDEDNNTKYYDSIAVINEKGELLDSYKKTHLYGQQERDNWDFGNSNYPVHSIFDFPVGVLNCYEAEFPELSRILALNGAKLIVAPTAADNYYVMTNGQRSDIPYPDISEIIAPANSYENEIFFAYANRTGYEKRDGNVWHYRGNSIVTGPHGDVLVAADNEQDTMLIADVIPAYYGDTHPETNYFYLKDRRPNLYEELTNMTADFYDRTNTEPTLSTNFLDGGYTYPENPDDEEK